MKQRFSLFLLLLGGLLAGVPILARSVATSGTWSATGSMVAARYRAAATLLPNGKVLVAGGANTVVLASAELYDPATGTWSATGSMATTRSAPTTTLLPNGKVLVTGGRDNTGTVLASAELYDPATGTWSATGSMATARYTHTATLLPNGKVLVAGGFNFVTGAVASAELYDPASGTWSPTGSMATARYAPTATLLPNGKVLVAGGLAQDNTTTLTSAELYDPASGIWSPTGSMATARAYYPATLLPSGKVLVAGGQGNTGAVASAELYDPASGTWSATSSMATARGDHTATLLPNGKVLVAGGQGNTGTVASAELFSSAFQVAARAYGALVSSLLIHAGPFGDVSIAGQGGNQKATVVSISVPQVLTIAAITDSASGNATASPAVADSSSILSTISVLGLQVNSLTAKAHADSTGLATGSTTLSSVTFNGQSVNIGTNPAPNTTISLVGLGTITFNEQTVVQQSGQTSMVVNAIDLKVTVGSLAGLQVVLGHTEASVTQDP